MQLRRNLQRSPARRTHDDGCLAITIMIRCWARSIGGCGGGPSREHIISKGQLPGGAVTVSGFPWCPEPKTIGLQSLVAKHLCRHHNERLSPADSEALHLLRALHRMSASTEARKQGKRQPRVVIDVDATRVEQWLLKTTFNMALVGGKATDGLLIDGAADERLARIAFGLDDFEEPDGFYWIARTADKIEGREMGSLEWESFVDPSTHKVIATRLGFHGYQMWLALPGAPRRADLCRGKSLQYVDTCSEIRCHWSKRRERARRKSSARSG